MFLLVMQASFGAYQPRSWHGGKEESKGVAGVHNTLDLGTGNDAVVGVSLDVYTCSLCIHKLMKECNYLCTHVYLLHNRSWILILQLFWEWMLYQLF